MFFSQINFKKVVCLFISLKMQEVLNLHFPQVLSELIKENLQLRCDHQECQEETGNCKLEEYCYNCLKDSRFRCAVCNAFLCYNCYQHCELCQNKICRNCYSLFDRKECDFKVKEFYYEWLIWKHFRFDQDHWLHHENIPQEVYDKAFWNRKRSKEQEELVAYVDVHYEKWRDDCQSNLQCCKSCQFSERVKCQGCSELVNLLAIKRCETCLQPTCCVKCKFHCPGCYCGKVTCQACLVTCHICSEKLCPECAEDGCQFSHKRFKK